MANKIRYGIQDVYVALATVSQLTHSVTYGSPRSLSGAVSISLDPEGDTSPFYADNVVYYRSTANNGYTGSLELALVPDWGSPPHTRGKPAPIPMNGTKCRMRVTSPVWT